MTTWAIVPVKPFLRAKSRLAGVLSADERAGLSQEFLAHTLQVLAAVPQVGRVLVVSGDPAALALARGHGARTVTEAGAPDLNAALERATAAALRARAEAVLVLPTDLPLLEAADVAALLEADGSGPACTIAPDRHAAGTNALWLRPPGLFAYAFGPGSFERHLRLAREAGVSARVCRRPGLGLDVDEPEDLRLYRAGLAAL